VKRSIFAVIFLAILGFILPSSAAASQAAEHPPIAAISSPSASPLQGIRTDPSRTADIVRTTLILGLLTILPALAICMTPFIRFVVVFSMIRHAFGMPETPPNQVLISLALFLTMFVMAPTLTAVNSAALQPFLAGSLSVEDALQRAEAPMRNFMMRQVRDQDIKTIYRVAKEPLPPRAADVGFVKLVPAYMLNELRVSFRMGFIIFLPFLLIDIVVSSILLSLGMLMVPPSTISLPIKLLMFVLIDGWSLVLQGLAGSIK
jgi:flagellar biosynthetic protein FliP